MSGQLKNNTGERKLRVTLLSAEWKASSNGDLTTINRELAIQMAKHPNVEVSVFLPQCSEEDKRDADSYNVKLIEAVKLFGFEPVDWLASLPDGHAMDCVLGHGVALGRQIQIIKKNPNYRHCKWIQVVHTAPEEIGMYKSISEGQQMQQTEIDLCEMADQVVTIGPKLTGAYKCQLREQDVFNLTPSIFTEFSDEQQASDERRKFCVLVTESGDSEDFDVKGYGIAAKAIANLKGEPYQLKFASKQRGQEDELKHKLLQCGIDSNQLIISSFDESRKTSANLFSMVDIAILPSKTEGFGLSALKAISAGLPVLVSGNSGIAEALRGVPTGSQCIVDSEDPADWARAIKAVRNKKRNVQLAEAKILRENYLQQFSWKEPCAFLVEKMCNLAFGMLPLPGSSTFDPEEELEEPRMKLQRMEGTLPSTLLSTSGHKRKLEVRHSTVKLQEKKGMLSQPGSSTFDPEEELEEPHMKLQRMEGTSPLTVVPITGHEKKLEEPSGKKGKMASAVAPSFRSSKETTNYAMLCRLLVDVRAHILRKTFDKRRPTGDLNAVLSSPPVHAVLNSLRKKQILSPSLWRKLYPAIKYTVSSKDFDIPLLMVLLRSICGLVRPATGWDTLPPAADTTLEAEIVRINCFRNKVYRHASEASVDDSTFNQYWQDIQDALVRLGGAGYQNAIDDLKKECMDPDLEEHYIELLKQCIMDEVSIKERLDEMEAIVNPKKRAGDKVVAEYSDALKESIKSQTEYLAQTSPTMSNVRTDDIFTNILMQHGRKAVEDLDVKRKSDVKRNERLRQYGQISEKQIESSQEIFISTDGKHPKSVLVTGKAGIGKTLFCQKLIRDWADNKLFRSGTNAEVPDFRFAYLLTFRQLNLLGDDPVTLKDILNRSSVLDDHSNIDDSIFEYILHHSEEVLIIIDGYDECSQREHITSNSDEKYPNNAKEKMSVAALCAKLIKGKMLRGSVVMITSRPDESDEMKAKYIYFDRYVEITGFSEPQVRKYIGKYFKNNDRMKNIVMDHITKNDNLVSLAHVPVLCFLMCSYFEYTLQQPKKNNPLPVKASDLYDEVVNMFVQKHDRNKRTSLEETLDELSKLAAQLLLERRFLFRKDDFTTLNSHEVESLCRSGLLHCGPPFRSSFSATTKQFCFTHLTLQEYLAARWFVKTRAIPPTHVSIEVALFMSGILSWEKDNEFEEKLIINRFLGDGLLANEATRGLLISKCLLQYEDIEFAKGIVKRFPDVFGIRSGCFDLFDVDIAHVDCASVSFTLNVFGIITAEDESEWSRITELKLTSRKVADAGVAILCQALQTPTCEVTELSLAHNQITDAGVVSLCQALQTPTCKVTTLALEDIQITDAGVISLSQALQTPPCKVAKLDLGANQITDAGIASLCQALQTPRCKVSIFRLSYNQITDAGVASLCQALKTPTCKVSILVLSYNQITDAGVASLCQALHTPTCKVKTLALDGNHITDAGVASLCQTLQTPTCKVTKLHLDANQITDAGGASLCQALQSSTCKVTELCLDNNQITDAGVASLCQALRTPTCEVTELGLNANEITDAGVASLCQALQTPTCKVTELSLEDNQITDVGVSSLCQALQTPTCKVTTLSLSGNQITDAGVVRLCQALQTPTCKVLNLDLSNNQITDASVASLCQAFQTPTCKITELVLEYNQITDAGVASLRQVSKTAACKVLF